MYILSVIFSLIFNSEFLIVCVCAVFLVWFVFNLGKSFDFHVNALRKLFVVKHALPHPPPLHNTLNYYFNFSNCLDRFFFSFGYQRTYLVVVIKIVMYIFGIVWFATKFLFKRNFLLQVYFKWKDGLIFIFSHFNHDKHFI